jgi:glycosyltransferase involved in cell wall biosynthesis
MDKRTQQVSVVIVTRNRQAALEKCLTSLTKQTVKPTEVVIIDNASTDETAKVVTDFAATQIFPVRRVVEKRIGYPIVYNRGLLAAKFDWVIFIDDDCVAVPGWLAAFTSAIAADSSAAKKVAAYVGQSQTQLPATVWSLAVLCADQLWKRAAITKNNLVTDLETLDNKNIAYFKPFLRKKLISFNEKAVTEPGQGAAEDADLGMQLQVAGAVARYLPKAKIFHQDPNTFWWYCKRLLSGAQANFWYQRRWRQKRTELQLGNKTLRFSDFWPTFCAEQNITGKKATHVKFIIMSGFWFVKIAHWWWARWA